ncbi:SDR family oxidoreductase [Nesterenkonia halotolerans]|uniref:NAD(P)-dependent dehydrogenase (Short-subunit alcohol dehydrogenase family) n=1 Tax=Nesterenkonia halotolerans TaxID=225325 RepID=A0ABR9J493_9MICC|nr:SDR family oxidoreductase [Nesterenkonia halotolerans]MBE1513657.1 NAD(P)-dependent dehydrogenase (short-subunit alcohol dehydrogenase family) [Nesterenkonia halotolerans]
MNRKAETAVPDLSGRRAVITGGSDGMGLQIAARIAAAGAEVVLPVRNRKKGEAAVSAIRRESPRSRVELADLDLSSLGSIAAFGQKVRDAGAPIHMLINNAGVMTPPARTTTAEGLELQFGTNHLGHFALTAQLFPMLSAGRARVSTQLSVAARSGEINWSDLNWERSYSGMKAYQQSKIALGLFALELDRRSRAEGWGLSSNITHPGIAPTSLLAARPELGRAQPTHGRRLIRALSRMGVTGTAESAGMPAVVAATAEDAQGGQFWSPDGFQRLAGAPALQKLYAPLTDRHAAARIWTVSEELAGVSFPAA